MAPLIEGEIPLYVKDVFNPTLAGTVIQGRACSVSDCKSNSNSVEVDTSSSSSPIKGITSINKVAPLTLTLTLALTLTLTLALALTRSRCSP